MATAPPLIVSLYGSLANTATIAAVTTNVGPAIASAGVRLSTAHSLQAHYPARWNVHAAGGKRLYHHSSPLIASRDSIRKVRTTSSTLPLDQRANFWYRSDRTGRSPYGDFKSESDARMRSMEQQWSKNIEKMNQVHEMMRRRHMEFMKRRLESEPYDVLFGWRNRMRAGMPQQMWVKGSDVMKANQPAEEVLRQSTEASEQATSSQGIETPSRAPEHIPEQESPSPMQYETAQQPTPQPTSRGSTSSLEYDPIANRMIYRRSDVIGHFETKIQDSPTNQSKPKQVEVSSEQRDLNPARAEFEQWKAARLSQDTADTYQQESPSSHARRSPSNASPMSRVANRAQLEDSFQKVHKRPAQDLNVDRSSRGMQNVRAQDEQPARPADILAARSSAEFDSVLENLSARIRDVGDRVEQLQQRGTSSSGANHQVRSSSESQEQVEEQLRKKFREFRKLTGSLPDTTPTNAEPGYKSISFKQLPRDNAPSATNADGIKSSPQHVYEILAYDPLTSEVSTTTVSTSEAAQEQVIALSDALSRLSEPAKFLPHLRLLKDRGFEPVTATKNMLVLRGIPDQAAVASEAAFSASAEADGNHVDSTSSGGGLGGRDPPDNLNHDAWGRLRARRWRRRRRFVRRVVFWSIVIGGVVYLSGVRSGYHGEKRKRSSSEKLPETEEAIYRAMREENKPSRRDMFPGMRRVTYPKENDS